MDEKHVEHSWLSLLSLQPHPAALRYEEEPPLEVQPKSAVTAHTQSSDNKSLLWETTEISWGFLLYNIVIKKKKR